MLSPHQPNGCTAGPTQDRSVERQRMVVSQWLSSPPEATQSTAWSGVISPRPISLPPLNRSKCALGDTTAGPSSAFPQSLRSDLIRLVRTSAISLVGTSSTSAGFRRGCFANAERAQNDCAESRCGEMVRGHKASNLRVGRSPAQNRRYRDSLLCPGRRNASAFTAWRDFGLPVRIGIASAAAAGQRFGMPRSAWMLETAMG
jgi:hypothetical protein